MRILISILVLIFLVLFYVQSERELDLYRGYLRVSYEQHQDFIKRDDDSAWLRRFALGYRLQRDFKIWDNEEWKLIQENDLPDFFKNRPEAVVLWQQFFKKYWSQDTQKFIDEAIARAAK